MAIVRCCILHFTHSFSVEGEEKGREERAGMEHRYTTTWILGAGVVLLRSESLNHSLLAYMCNEKKLIRVRDRNSYYSYACYLWINE